MLKEISEYPGYFVDEVGNVFSARPKNGRGPLRDTPTPLVRTKTIHGYMAVGLYKNAVLTRTVAVHRLVAKAFVCNPNGLPEVNHKNGVKDDNRFENLEWCTRKHNIVHSRRVLHKVVGQVHGNHTLTDAEVLEIRADKNTTARELSRRYGVGPSQIRNIRFFRQWKHLAA